ncbi:ATP-dependent RNA helicase RhlE [Pseudodesulfovibrio sediminis]|uniref:ATP-dependent RNA helicase RhlE n=2 Tax=Pseudodesulfovibrio sediminis TaxID=2810563 RepID=A0ABN6EWH2_9BACT|nr:ATP-dependent RNA helicase RhlE [Pseudodesulfovibrio sediminis]
MGLAQTGTGKTAAFALPTLQRLLDKRMPAKGAPTILVLAPTRELALQIHESYVNLGKQTGVRSAAVIGGVGMNPQIKAFGFSRIIVACPGRLVRLMKMGKVSLNNIDTLVLDEADRMLDMGFMPDIKRILAKLPAKRQNLLFSATMPDDIRHLAEDILNRPKTVQVANTVAVKAVDHAQYKAPAHLKVSLLSKILAETNHESVLIFTRTKHKAKNLARKLCNEGRQCTFLQGNMSQGQRQRALDGFKSGQFDIMVATDIAARGIDCDRISHVINFDMPDTVETYTHRVGRTGRAGRSGSALSLVTPDERSQIRSIERIMNITMEQCSIEGFDHNAASPKPDPRNTRANKPKGRFSNSRKRGASQGRNTNQGRSNRGRRAAA